MAPRILVFKYGVGNVFSVKAALERAGALADIKDSLEDIEDYDALVLPGVGTMPAAMRRLTAWRGKVERHLEKRKPLLGICLGLQLLFEESEELGPTPGLGLLPGRIEKLRAKPLPHIGWNLVEPMRPSELLKGLEKPFYAYYIHSYAYKGVEKPYVKAHTRVGGEVFAAVVEKPPLYATQFHPERSGRTGASILSRFVEIAGGRGLED
ncbi:MAG: imidazole glycerol phosphate synthase subunit HisH [Desulfurococcales archaeon]|nr:imidazole glycerol phosphate synthase subunit HisH [Desulfurococcales archaeon]